MKRLIWAWIVVPVLAGIGVFYLYTSDIRKPLLAFPEVIKVECSDIFGFDYGIKVSALIKNKGVVPGRVSVRLEVRLEQDTYQKEASVFLAPEEETWVSAEFREPKWYEALSYKCYAQPVP